jgi:ribosome-binding factor A
MTSHRTQRVADLIREVLADVIRRELRDPRIGFVTLTDVRVTADLKHARIFVSELGEQEEREASLAALNRAAGFLRHALGREVRLKHIPELVFVHDTVADSGRRVDDLLRQIHDQHPPDAPAPGSPDDPND